MPRGLLILLLILLIGGYFLLHRGGTSQEPLPSLTLKAVVNEGDNGYIVGADGYLNLPSEKEYNVSGVVYVSSNGVHLKEQSVQTTVKGPSRLPLSIAGIPLNTSNVAVGASLTVISDGKEMNFSVETPVTFPPKESLLRLPDVFVYPTVVDRTSTGYSVTLKVILKNPNDFEVKVNSPRLLVGNSNFTLPIDSIPAGDEASTEITVDVESNVISGEVKGQVEWSGVKKDFSVPLSISLPEITPPSPLYSLSLEFLGATNEGIKMRALVEVNNPSTLPLEVPALTLKVYKDDTTKEVDVSEPFTLGPLEEKNFSKEVTAITFFKGGTVTLYAGDTPVVSAPVDLLSPTVAPVPEVNVWMEEVNTGAYVIHVYLKSSVDYNLDVKDFDVVADYGGTDLANFDKTSFSFTGTKEVTVGSGDNPLALPEGTRIIVSFTYGLESLGLWNSVRFQFG